MHWVNFFHIYQPPNWSAAIIRKVVKESYRPLLAMIKKHRKLFITLNINGSLTEQLAEHGHTDIITAIKTLARAKCIELTGSAMYHPILPLLPDTEIKRQIELNTAANKKYFGSAYNPKGFFAPEMAYSNHVGKLISRLGFRWVIIDEISAAGKLAVSDTSRVYRLKNSNLNIVFRNRLISDYFSFHCELKKPSSFISLLTSTLPRNKTLITAMDGENLGHHRPGLDTYWQTIVTNKNITTLTISQFIASEKHKQAISPKQASWSSQASELRRGIPFALWQDPQNPIHANQWLLVHHTIAAVHKNTNHPNYKTARQLLDKRLASDQFWWASAKPWWSLRIITKKTKELLAINRLLEKDSAKAQKLANKIISTAQRWQQTKKYKLTAARYLTANEQDGIRYIGGKKILAKNI